MLEKRGVTVNILSAEHLFKTFSEGFLGRRKHKAVLDVSFQIHAGEAVGLAGNSGAGKSTVARLLMHLIPADRGRVFFQDQDLFSLHPAELNRTRMKMRMIFQNPAAALNPRMTVQESMAEPSKIAGQNAHITEQIKDIMERLQLRHELMGRYPHQLSGGELQRICLGRILLLQPDLLILDEPTSMLDVSVQAQIMEILREEREKRGMAFLLISHDMDLLRACCTRIGVMHQGKLLEMETAESLFSHPRTEYTKELIEAFRDI